MSETTYAPRGLGPGGRRLWKKVTDEYELAEHEQRLLLEICRTADQCDRLYEVTSESASASPAMAELRQQRLALARLISALKVPADTVPGPMMKSRDKQRWARARSGEAE